MSEIYNREYYLQYDVGNNNKMDYETDEPLKNFLALVADRIVEDLHPKTVLDAGCAMGHLVTALRDRGVEAYGIDISEYAVSRVREDIRPYCVVGSLAEDLPEKLPSQFDLIISIEVLEHLAEEDGKKAIENLCRHTDCMIFASTPDDFEDPTHINVRPREYWASLFAQQGFYDHLDYRPFYLADYAFCFKRNHDWLKQVDSYERNIRLSMWDIKALKDKFGVEKQIVSIMIDSGQGYQEAERIYSCHTSETPYVNIGITVPEGGKLVRIDPVHGYACLVSGMVVQPCEPGVFVNLKEHNGICIENHFLFEATEPRLIYEVTGKTPCVLQIIATVTVLPSMEISRHIRQVFRILEKNSDEYADRINHQMLEISELMKRADEANLQVNIYREQNERLQATSSQYVETVSEINRRTEEISELSRRMEEVNRRMEEVSEINRRTEEISELSRRMEEVNRKMEEVSEINRKTEEISELSRRMEEVNRRMEEISEINQKMEEISGLHREIEEANYQIALYKKRSEKLQAVNAQHIEELAIVSGQMQEAQQWKNRLEELELERNTLNARLDSMNTNLCQALDQLTASKAIIEALHNSTSWKITAPMRAIMDAIRRKNQVTSITTPVDPAQPQPAIIPQVETSPVQNNVFNAADMLPESMYRNRQETDEFIGRLSGYDIVSFDIFDTLILRAFDKPTDVFRLLGHRLGEESFSRLRVQAEQEARQKKPEQNGEVNIYEIYDELSKFLAIDKEQVIQQELQMEMDCCFANPFMKEVFDKLVRRGQKVIIISDMYWPRDLMAALLHSCGYEDYEALYVSCDYGCGKWNQALYEIVEVKHPESKSYIHIGDNLISDVENAGKAGWDTLHYPSCRELGDALRPQGLDRLSVSAYNSIINSHLHADSKIFTPAYEHGFRYAGYLVCGFCEWLNKYVKENEIDRVLFLARDADILYKVYNKYYKQVENRYVIISRLATWEMVFETNTEEFIKFFFSHRANMGNQKIGTALEETDLDVLIPLLKKNALSPGSVLTQKNYPLLREFIQNHKDVIIKHYAASRKAGQDYFREMIGDAKKVCAVDIGWSGQILINMRKIIRDMYDGKVTLSGAYMAVTDNEATTGYVESGIITTYLFHSCMNQDVAIRVDTVEGDMQAKFMEATFTSDQPTLLKYVPAKNGGTEFIYGVKSADAALVKQMQRGILDFAELWQKRTKPMKPHLQIMPTDAKRIVDEAITNFRYCYAILGDIREWEFSLPNFKGQGTLTTLGNILKKRGLV